MDSSDFSDIIILIFVLEEGNQSMNKEPRFHGTVSPQSHKTMSHIKGKDTKIEIRLRKALWNRGIRYRKNYKKIPGSPDIALTQYKIAIFCDSEFFHGKDWNTQRSKLKKGANGDYWIKKITRNMERDIDKDHSLNAMGWTVLHFWGKDIKNDLDSCIQTIEEAILASKIGDDYDG